LPLYPSDEIPVIGFVFSSNACSFEACCHSFDSVFGSGPPYDRIMANATTVAPINAEDKRKIFVPAPGSSIGFRGPCGPNEI